jgi:protein-S-isoprenylcysteine O-methyltransferase Ste14
MKKNICWGLFILSMALYIDYFYFKSLLPLTSSVVSANIALFLMIFLIHNFFYPKNTTDHAQIISYPPMIMLFSINLSVSFLILGSYIDFIKRILLFNAGFLDSINSTVFNLLGIHILYRSSGLFFIFLSIVIIYLAVKQFTNIEEDPNPTTSSKSIIAAGIYNWTRNPMYLGLVIFQFGLGCAFISSEIISFSLLTLTIFNYFVVKREEEYLEKKFGDTYLVYKKRVRRWL